MQLKKMRINSCELYAKAESQMTLDDDYNLPDYRPDIVKVLREKGELHFDEGKAAAGAAWIKGHLVFRILYRSDQSDGKVSCLKGEIPFQEKLNMDGVSEYDTIQVSGEIEDLSARVIHSRKINIRAVILLRAGEERETVKVVCTGTMEEEGIEQKYKKHRALQLLCAMHDEYRQKNEFLLPQGKPNIREILWKSIELRNVDTWMERDGIRIKGEIEVSILYQEEGENSKLQWYETMTPLDGTVECKAAPGENVIFCVREQQVQKELEVKPDADGEERMLVTELTVGLSIRVWQEQEVELLEDLYAPGKKLTPVFENVRLERLLVKNDSTLRVMEQMKLAEDSEQILQICSCEGSVHIETTKMTEKGMFAEGILQVELLYITADDQMPVGSAKEIFPFEQTIEIPEMAENSQNELDCTLGKLSAVMTDQNHVEMKAEITLALLSFGEEEVRTVAEVQEEQPDLEELQKRPGLIGYIAKESGSLWEIAKENHTTVRDIMEENGKTVDTVQRGERILIIKKVEY